MQAFKRASSTALRAVVFACLFTMTACQTLVPEPAPEVVPDPVQPAPEKPVVVKPAPPKPAPPPPVAVLFNGDIATYTEVADALQAVIPNRLMIIDLSTQDSSTLQSQLTEHNVAQVVAIGDKALEQSRLIPELDVIYAQAFTADASMRGVPALPPASMQLSYWLVQQPTIRRVGVLGSAAFADALEEIEQAGALLGIEVDSQIVTNDKQAWFEFRRMLPTIDGFVFLPDANILSPSAIQRMLAHGSKNELAFLTYNALLFKLGAQLHITHNPRNVAEQLARLIDDRALQTLPQTTFRARTRGMEEFVDVNG